MPHSKRSLLLFLLGFLPLRRFIRGRANISELTITLLLRLAIAKMILLLLLALAGVSPFAAGDITVPVSQVSPLPLETAGAVTSATELFRQSCPEESSSMNSYPPPEVLMSSYTDFGEHDSIMGQNGTLFASSDSVVRGAIEAWAQHQHLVLRPDEIWFEILAQLNFYMSAHAEDIRHLFVDHEGKEEIKVLKFTWRDIIAAFGSEIQKRVKTDWLLEWIMPEFTTTTYNDHMTATVLMMGLMQHYFEFSGGIVCGLPSVTLMGERADWVKLFSKLDRLAEWGEQPKAYAANLRPILSRFVQTWDKPESPEIKSFWAQIVRADRKFSCGVGAVEFDVSGWITGLLHWKHDGSLRVDPDLGDFRSDGSVTLDGITYVPEELESLPVGYAKAPLKMLDYPSAGTNTQAYVLAGNVGVRRTLREDGEGVTAQPLSAWFMYAPVDTNATSGSWYGSSAELEGIARGFDACGVE